LTSKTFPPVTFGRKEIIRNGDHFHKEALGQLSDFLGRPEFVELE